MELQHGELCRVAKGDNLRGCGLQVILILTNGVFTCKNATGYPMYDESASGISFTAKDVAYWNEFEEDDGTIVKRYQLR